MACASSGEPLIECNEAEADDEEEHDQWHEIVQYPGVSQGCDVHEGIRVIIGRCTTHGHVGAIGNRIEEPGEGMPPA